MVDDLHADTIEERPRAHVVGVGVTGGSTRWPDDVRGSKGEGRVEIRAPREEIGHPKFDPFRPTGWDDLEIDLKPKPPQAWRK